MKKRLSLALAAGSLVAMMLPGVASAAPPANARENLPVGWCPTGWELGTPTHPGGQALDWNGDTHACLKVVPGGGVVLIDNVVQHKG